MPCVIHISLAPPPHLAVRVHRTIRPIFQPPNLKKLFLATSTPKHAEIDKYYIIKAYKAASAIKKPFLSKIIEEYNVS